MCNDEKFNTLLIAPDEETQVDNTRQVESECVAEETKDKTPIAAEEELVSQPESGCADEETKKESPSQVETDTAEKVDTQPRLPGIALEDISSNLKLLETLFTKRLAYDEGKEKILDKLHAELQDYKSDLYAKLTRPIFYDIAVVLDDIRKVRSGLDPEKQVDSDSLIESIAESLICLLDKYEVLPFNSEAGTKYDATKQRMVKTQCTTDLAQVGLVAESVSAGYLQKEQIIYPEKIIAYKLEVM